jgi:hypothetical protein
MDYSVIYPLDDATTPRVAGLMARLRPEWWDVRGATDQLSRGIGWCLESEPHRVTGWLLCQHYELYRSVEIESLGYDRNGQFVIGTELQPLVETCEGWSQDHEVVNVRFVMGSRGLSCHGKKLGSTWEELKELRVVHRPEFEWFLAMSYEPSGLLPDICGTGHHGIMLLKRL